MENKFKPGDLVKGITNNYGITNTNMTEAAVLEVKDDRIRIVIRKHIYLSNIGDKYTVDANDFEKIGELLPFDRDVVIKLIQEGERDEWVKYNLCGADLSGASLDGASLDGASLDGASLDDASLNRASLDGASLDGASLNDASLDGASLDDASLDGASLNDASGLYLVCPETGAFDAYKKASDKIVHLRIPKTAKRSSATSRKCRASAAKVLDITELDGSPCDLNSVSSDRDSNFVYTVGKTVKVNDFDENRWNECSTGIHFFMTRDEAVRY